MTAPKKKKRKSTTGRPVGKPRYVPSEEHLHTAYIGGKKGLSHAQIAESIGISRKTIQRNLDSFEPYIKKGRDESEDKLCERVENALLKKATGYEFEERHQEKKVDPNGKILHMTMKTVKKYYPPSDIAIFFYLCNRMPDRWQNVQKPNVDDEHGKGDIQRWFEAMQNNYTKAKDKKPEAPGQ